MREDIQYFIVAKSNDKNIILFYSVSIFVRPAEMEHQHHPLSFGKIQPIRGCCGDCWGKDEGVKKRKKGKIIRIEWRKMLVGEKADRVEYI